MKMYSLGIRGNVWKWTSNFLSSKTAKCSLKDLSLRHLLVCLRDQLSLLSYSISSCKISTRIYHVKKSNLTMMAPFGYKGSDTKIHVLSKTIEQELQKYLNGH